MMPIQIAPSILAADITCLGEEVDAMGKAKADSIHIDVMDGHFVQNLAMGPDIVSALRKRSSLQLDAHLMISSVESNLESFINAGADVISIHAKAMKASEKLYKSLESIRKAGRRAGVALDPGSSISSIESVLPIVDRILVMTVKPGLGGQTFLQDQLETIRECRKRIDKVKHKIDLQVDGGINENTAPLAVEAGANVLVAGTAAFAGEAKKYTTKVENYTANLAALRSAINVEDEQPVKTLSGSLRDGGSITGATKSTKTYYFFFSRKFLTNLKVNDINLSFNRKNKDEKRRLTSGKLKKYVTCRK